jgi:hypothetical protein
LTLVYFAYGSNLHSGRLRARAPGARALGAARLRGVRLVCNKLGRDGTAKANLEPAPSSHVWGALFSLPEPDWRPLDRAEAGYERIEVRVEHDGAVRAASTYRSQRLTTEPALRPDYKRFIVEGAREHGLPPEWITLLEALPAL